MRHSRCAESDAEAFEALVAGGEDASFEDEEVEALRDVCACFAFESGDVVVYFLERGGVVFLLDEEIDFEEGDLELDFWVAEGADGVEVFEVVCRCF